MNELNAQNAPPLHMPSTKPVPPVLQASRKVTGQDLPATVNRHVAPGSKRHQKEMQFKLVGAIERENLQQIRELIDNGVNINCTILYSKTPLIHAIEQEYVEVIKILLESGADVEQSETTAWQRKPLHFAISTNCPLVPQILLNHGANVNVHNGCGITPLHQACYHGYADVVTILLAQGASLRQGDHVGRDALHRAVEGKHWGIVDTLLDYKELSVNGSDKFGWTPLYQTIMSRDMVGAKILIERGADVNWKDNKGDTPLHVACDRSTTNFKIMLSTSVDFYHRVRRIPTSEVQKLLQEEDTTQFAMVQLLVNTGADVNAVNDFLTKPVHMNPNPSVFRYLILAGSYVDHDMVLFANRFESPFSDMTSWLEDQFMRQRTLERLCRTTIRVHLGQSRDIQQAVKNLRLPGKIIDYLNLVELNY